MVKYHKLVRDKIPAIIEAQGKQCRYEVLSDAEFLLMAEEKLHEELREYDESHDPEELADLLEVIFAVAAARGISKEELEAIRAEKAQERGGFEKKYLLLEVSE